MCPPTARANLLGAAVLTALTLLLSTSPVAAAEPARLSLERLFTQPALAGTPPSTPRWSPDSRHLAFTWNDAALPQRDLWVVAADGSGLRRLPSTTGAPVAEFVWLPQASRLLTLRGGEIWSVPLNGGPGVLLATAGEGASQLSVSADGRTAAYLEGGDLWLLDLRDGRATAATDVGIPGLSALGAGRYDRAEREIGPGIWSGPSYAWSPDGRWIAVHLVDRRQMRAVPFPDYLGAETDPNLVRRGYPGDANESRTVGLLRVGDGELRLLDLDDTTANQVVDFSWSPGGLLLLDVAADTAVDRWLYTVDPQSGARREIWHSHRPSRIYTAFASAWHPDGEHVVILSDLDDRYGLYSVSIAADGAVPTRLTDPAYDVLSGPDVVAGADAIFYAANGVSPYEQHVYRVGADGGEPRRVTTMPGQNSGFPSPDGRHLAVLHSSDTTPPELYLIGAGGGPVRVTHSPPPEFAQHAWVSPRYVSFPSRIDDRVLHARVLEPADLNREGSYPVLFGPVYSNTVRNRWAGVYGLVQQLLVQQGYIVVQVDVRGSTGYGRAFREAFLTDFAGDDIEDLASAVAWLKTLPYVDPDRLGLWGSSYGGTLTAYTLLTRPGLFCAGAAAAAAVDPHFFGTDDVAIVRRPDTHPEIFERAALRHAAALEDHLLLIHGMRDQVVPFKTTVVLADALIRAGKDFEFAFAPGATHAWSRESPYARYLFGRLLGHFERYLMAPDACRPASVDVTGRRR